MKNSGTLSLLGAIALLAIGVVLLVRQFRGGDGVPNEVFFYDLSEKKLFTAPRTAVPPVRGVNDAELDGVRAIVISTSGKPKDKKSRQVAYLEKYAPELKTQMEAAQKTGAAPEISRAMAQELRFVRRLEDSRWYPMSSSEGERIVSEWAVPGPDGVTPVVCSP